MIRQGFDTVPIVQPKYRLEEDNRLAVERRLRRCQGGQQSSVTAATHVERYRITSCDDIMAVLKNSTADGDEKNKSKDIGSVHLFSLLPSPELGDRTPKTLHVLQAPKKNWKRIRRTVYRTSLRSLTRSGNIEGDGEVDDDVIDDDSAEDGELLQFSSLPVQEYENMACLFLRLPDGGMKGAVAQASVLDTPLHALRYERTKGAKEGQGISTSWYSGIDARSVGFKRNYIDNDDDDIAGGNLSDNSTSEAQRSTRKKENSDQHTRKKNKAEHNSIINNKNSGTTTEADEGGILGIQQDNVQKTTSDEVSVLILPTSALETKTEVCEAVDKVDFTGVKAEDLGSLTASLLKQWASAGKSVMPFSELAKIVLKSHPEYAVMKEKHQVSQTRQEALNWFRESQSKVRTHILHLGYTMDSSSNVYLSRQRGT